MQEWKKMEEKMTFEKANQILEETVNRIENETLSLEESMELYAKACELLAFCNKKLNQYKGRIAELQNGMLKEEEPGNDE